jgi:hypothetical protein
MSTCSSKTGLKPFYALPISLVIFQHFLASYEILEIIKKACECVVCLLTVNITMICQDVVGFGMGVDFIV